MVLCLDVLLQNSFSEQVAAEGSVGHNTFLGDVRVSCGSMAPWGPGCYSDKTRSKVKLGRQPTDQGPIQQGPWPDSGMVIRGLQAGKPTMCACVLQQ